MDYDELAKFVQWMKGHATSLPHVWINTPEVGEGEEHHLQFDGVIYPEDVERFNVERFNRAQQKEAECEGDK